MMLSVESSCSTLSTEGNGKNLAPETLRLVCTAGCIVEEGVNSVEDDTLAALKIIAFSFYGYLLAYRRLPAFPSF
jgi:DNA polymerase elongation subunit (family B)